MDAPQPHDRVEHLEDLLRLEGLHRHAGGAEIGEAARVLHAGEHEQLLGRDAAAGGDELLEVRLDAAGERFRLQRGVALHGEGQFVDLAQPRPRAGRLFDHFFQRRLEQALHQHLDAAVGQFALAEDEADGAQPEDALGRLGGLVGRVALRHHEDEPLARESVLHRGEGNLARDEERHHLRREHHQIAHRQKRQHVGDVEWLLLLLGHGGHFIPLRAPSRRPALPPVCARRGSAAASR